MLKDFLLNLSMKQSQLYVDLYTRGKSKRREKMRRENYSPIGSPKVWRRGADGGEWPTLGYCRHLFIININIWEEEEEEDLVSRRSWLICNKQSPTMLLPLITQGRVTSSLLFHSVRCSGLPGNDFGTFFFFIYGTPYKCIRCQNYTCRGEYL